MKLGHEMLVPRTSAQTWSPAFTGRYDDEELGLLQHFIVDGSLAMDVGACFGFYSVPLGLAAQPRGALVIAFEPVPENCKFLSENLSRNQLDQVVTIVRCALGRSKKSIDFGVEMDGSGNAAVPVRGLEDWGPCGSFVTATVERLDDLDLPGPCAGRRITLVKMDVEGLEMEVLAGAEKTIDQHRPTVFGEFSRIWFERRRIKPTEPLEWAQRRGYLAYEVRPERRHTLSARHRLRLVELSMDGARQVDSVLLVPGELVENDGLAFLSGALHPLATQP